MEVELVEEGTGTIKYLVAETGVEPYVAQDIVELLDNVVSFDDADVCMLTPDLDLVPVHVASTDSDNMDWEVTLGTEEGGELVERVEFAVTGPGEDARFDTHIRRVNGWPDPTT